MQNRVRVKEKKILEETEKFCRTYTLYFDEGDSRSLRQQQQTWRKQGENMRYAVRERRIRNKSNSDRVGKCPQERAGREEERGETKVKLQVLLCVRT